ncbi:MAG: hypothetical protein AAB759_02070 [Patescibacteria group bacterium]
MKTFFGFALADSMFAKAAGIRRRSLTVEEAKAVVQQGVESCCNASHAATIAAMRERFGIDVPIPEAPPRVELKLGDRLVVMGVRGLPRLTDRHEYSAEEIEGATFAFSIYEVESVALGSGGCDVCGSDEGLRTVHCTRGCCGPFRRCWRHRLEAVDGRGSVRCSDI